jgi:hypothetical protein
MRFLLAMEDALLVADRRQGGFDARLELAGRAPRCLAADPGDRARLYCGTFGEGLWRSDDAGSTWTPAPGLSERQITAVAVSAIERGNGSGLVFAGSEPSKVFRSEDGGATWDECVGLDELPSSSRWSFPPRPHTHHVRWIAPDPVVAGRLFVAIEAGALIRSLDGGASWTRPDDGLDHDYLWSVAVDPRDPGIVIVSAASGPWTAHLASDAESFLYRRANGGAWTALRQGLPEPSGTTVSVVTADDARPGVFYAASNRGLYQSLDRGESWKELPIDWPDRLRTQRAAALLVLEAGDRLKT